MNRALCFGVAAALAFACGRNDRTTSTDTSQPAATPAPASAPADATGVPTGTSGSNDLVALTGCLQRGPSANGAVGTTGTGSTASKDRPDTNPAPSSPDRFVLINAKPSDASGAPTSGTGVGRNGAGASGGPLLTGTASYALEGGDLVGHENQQVRVTGRLIDDTLAGGVLSGMRGGSAADANNRDAARGTVNSRIRRITVDSVTMVAANCEAK